MSEVKEYLEKRIDELRDEFSYYNRITKDALNEETRRISSDEVAKYAKALYELEKVLELMK